MPKAKQILIAEDERALAGAMELKLGWVGFAVSVVGDGEATLAALEKNHYDLLLLDLVMPKQDGFAVLQAMHDKKSVIPVIVMSNLSQTEDETRVKDLGVLAYFVKSDTPIAEIAAYVQKTLA